LSDFSSRQDLIPVAENQRAKSIPGWQHFETLVRKPNERNSLLQPALEYGVVNLAPETL